MRALLVSWLCGALAFLVYGLRQQGNAFVRDVRLERNFDVTNATITEDPQQCQDGAFFNGKGCEQCKPAVWDGPLQKAPQLAPFFLYGDTLAGIDWDKMVCRNQKGPIQYAPLQGLAYKHSDDVWFRKWLQNHTSRVMDPGKAKIFVVDAYLNVLAAAKVRKNIF